MDPRCKQFSPSDLYRGTLWHRWSSIGESQSTSSGNHSKRISNLYEAVTFISESMISHLFVELWEKQYMKDDFSGFVELISATAADHFAVADALVQWYSRFGMPLMHVSDQGSHCKDKVIKEFNRILQINHRMTTAYSPWANGTVDKVNNDIQKLLRSLLSEWQMESSQWPLVLPMIQSVLNHLLSPSRANCAPFKIMTGLDVFQSAVCSI